MGNEAKSQDAEMDLINSIELVLPKRKRGSANKEGRPLTMRDHCAKMRQGWR